MHPRHNEKGFALPLSMGVGLVMIVIAIVMVVRSNQSQITSLSQSSSITSLAAAETGVSKVQSMLNRYREFATYPSDCAGGDCWTQFKAQIKNRDGCNSYFDDDGDNNDDAFTSELVTKNWIPIDNSDPLKGFYRLESYQFDPITRRGTLTINGADRVANGNPTGGVTQLTVDIPVVITGTPDPLLANQDLSATEPVSCSYIELPDLPVNNIISLTAAIDTSETLPRDSDIISGQQKYIYKFDSLFPSENSIELGNGEALNIRAVNGAKTTVVLITDHNILINGGRLDIQSDANFIVVSSKNINLMQSTPAPDLLPPIFNRAYNPIAVQFFLLGDDNSANRGGTEGELVIQSQSATQVNFMAYGPNATVDLEGLSGSAQFYGSVWAQRFLVSPASSNFVQRNIDTAANHPSPWDNPQNISTLFNQLQPVSAWKQEEKL